MIMVHITEQEAVEKILALKDSNKGHLMSVHYMRKNPKCTKCGKRYDSFESAPTSCLQISGTNICNGQVEFDTFDIIRFNVKNPGEGITKPGQGIRKGKDFFQALEEDKCIKYYSFTREGDRTDGKKGGYRQFKIENLIDMAIDGKKYAVDHK